MDSECAANRVPVEEEIREGEELLPCSELGFREESEEEEEDEL